MSWRVGEELSWQVHKFRKLLFLHINCSQIKKSAFPKHGVNRKVVDNHLVNISGKFEPCIYSIFRENEEKLIFFIRNHSFWPQNG